MRPLVHATLAVSCAALGASPLLAQAALRPLEIQDAVGAKRLHIQGRIAAISSDGELVAYTICDPRRVNAADSGGTRQYAVSRGAAYGSQGCDVWLGPVAGGETRNLTSGSGNEWGPSWSPDGRLLAFYSDRDGAPRVWLWDRQAGATRRLSEAVTRTFLGLEVPVWTPNGRHVVVKLRPETVSDSPPPAAVTVARSATADSAARSTVVVFRSPRSAPASTDTARAPSDESLADLGILDAGTGAARRLVRGVSTIDYKVSADGRFVAYLNQRRSATNDYLSEYFLAVASLEDGLVRELVPRIRQQWPAMAMSWSPDGRWLAYTAATPADSGAQRPASNARPGRGGSLFIVPVEDGTPRAFAGAPDNVFDALTLRPLWDERGEHVYVVGQNRVWRAAVATGRIAPLTADASYDVQFILPAANERQIWSPDGARSLIVATNDGRTRKRGFHRIDVATGRAELLRADDRIYGSTFSAPVVAPNGRFVVLEVESAGESPDLWIAQPDFQSPRRLSALNPQLGRYAFGRSRLIEFRGADGQPLRASLLLPASYEEGKRYPLVVWVYPNAMGSEAVNRFGMIGYSAYNMHMLSTRGYAVLWPDIPTGRGTVMRDLMDAVMPALDQVVALGIADPERLAVMGQSAGGYSTIALLVQTTRFKAAVMNAGYGDLTAMYGSMSPIGTGVWIPTIERGGGNMGAPPWEAPLRYVENSPVFYLDRVETPLILQAGGADANIVPYSDQVWVGLQQLGKNVTYLRYAGEGHVLASYPNLMDYWNRVIAFFGEHLGGRQVNAARQSQ